jgi:hypothetical protein
MSTNGKRKKKGAEQYYSRAARKALASGYGHGGAREGSGRPRKENPDDYVQITCVLRKDTVEKLRAGAGGGHKFFGGFLQWTLDRYPIATHDEYLAMRDSKPVYTVGPRRRKIPVVFAGRVRPRKVRRPRKPSQTELLRQQFLKKFEPV